MHAVLKVYSHFLKIVKYKVGKVQSPVSFLSFEIGIS